MLPDPTQPPPASTGFTRREVVGILGAAGAALAGYRLVAAQGTALPDCVVTPSQTEGPYFVDELLRRADIRRDPTTDALADGLPLRLRLNVSRVDGAVCSPLAGATVDVWQCDALGVYSDVQDFQGLFDTRGRKFLRGYQVTDARGAVEFLTVYPGWYAGRTVHIHFKVRVPSGPAAAQEFTSQFYFDDAITDRVHARPPYAAKGVRDTRNQADRIYRDRNSGSNLMLRLAPEGQGYLGTFGIGLRGL